MNKTDEKIYTKNYFVAALALFSAFLWGSATPSIKIGYELFEISSSYEKIAFAGFRFLLSSGLIFSFCLLTKRRLKLSKKNIFNLLILGLIQTTIQYIFFYIGLSNTSGTKGAILSATNTLFSAILVRFAYKEDKLNIKKVIGLILGFSGVVIVNLSGSSLGGGFNFTGDGFIIVSSLTGAIAGIYTKKLTEEIDPFLITGYQLFLGSLLLIGAGIIGGGANINFTPKGSLLLVYLAFISAAAFSLWSILLKYNPVSKVTIYKFTIPFFGVFLSYVFLGERLIGPSLIIAIILVSSSVILISK